MSLYFRNLEMLHFLILNNFAIRSRILYLITIYISIKDKLEKSHMIVQDDNSLCQKLYFLAYVCSCILFLLQVLPKTYTD